MHALKTRRAFLQESAAVGVGFWVGGRVAAAPSRSANEKLDIAVIGTMGQGQWNRHQLVGTGQNIVALCDVDEKLGGAAREEHPKASFHTDYRRLFDGGRFDAVLIATPDHSHAIPTLLAIAAGKHVYCEKPLAHTVREARLVRRAARKAGVATQMGTQKHADGNYRRVVELVKSGAIGEIGEVHVWAGSHWSGGAVPTEEPPVPEGLHYDLWLGDAPYRPYHPAYLPANWRGWWSFGGGTLGDMACHHVDLSFWALDLKVPKTIEAEGPSVDAASAPPTLKVHYTFEARGKLPPVRLTWYSSGLRPPQFEKGLLPEWGDGTLFVGSEGMLLADYGKHVLLPEEKFKDFKRPERSIPESPGHHAEWVRACKGGEPALCRFDYAGPLTECVLLGNVAYRCGKKLEWDPRRLRASNCPEAGKYIDKEYRKGWELPV